jgi:hypothetical protein
MTVMLLALLLAAPLPPPATLYDDVVMVGPSKTRTLSIPIVSEPTRVICSYEVLEGGSGVRAVLLRSEEAELWRRGEAHDVLAATAFSRQGAFSFVLKEPGSYQLVLDNRLEARGAAEVHLLVRLAMVDSRSAEPQSADPVKGQILVWSSLAFFAVCAVFTGAKLKGNLDRRSL